jgi:hypothetical protein
MRPTLAAAALSAVFVTSSAPAQTAAPSGAMPGFPGYGHPALGPGDCKALGPSQAQCIIPARTAGRYLIDAVATSTATGAGAVQSIAIGGSNWTCAQAVNRTPWSSGPRSFHVQCLATVLTDEPLAVNMLYRDTNATKDPKGPVLTVRPIPWSGILEVQTIGAK